MKKIVYISLSLLFIGCASVKTNITEVKPNEIGLPLDLSGKIFIIDCFGNGSADQTKVREECIKKAAEVAYNKEYKYFSVLAQDSNTTDEIAAYTTYDTITTNTSYISNTYGVGGYSSGISTTTIPKTNYYNIRRHSNSIGIILITEEELNKWGNYYIVSDYYTEQK